MHTLKTHTHTNINRHTPKMSLNDLIQKHNTHTNTYTDWGVTYAYVQTDTCTYTHSHTHACPPIEVTILCSKNFDKFNLSLVDLYLDLHHENAYIVLY